MAGMLGRNLPDKWEKMTHQDYMIQISDVATAACFAVKTDNGSFCWYNYTLGVCSAMYPDFDALSLATKWA
jgi:hypothetical protein